LIDEMMNYLKDDLEFIMLQTAFGLTKL